MTILIVILIPLVFIAGCFAGARNSSAVLRVVASLEALEHYSVALLAHHTAQTEVAANTTAVPPTLNKIV